MIAFTDSDQVPVSNRLVMALNLIGLSLLAWGVIAEAHPGRGDGRVATLILLGLAVAGWVGWSRMRFRPAAGRPMFGWLALTALAGGGLAAFTPLAAVFVGVAALGATIAWPLRQAGWIVAAGPAAMLISVAGSGHNFGLVLVGLAAALTATILGASRRQALERTASAARMQVAEARAEAERARAELLDGRNHLARELHDVLAHTLSALSLQLEALDALVSTGSSTAAVREQLDSTKRLVREGMEEARGAVRALREDAPPLEEQLNRLACDRQAQMLVSGPPRQLSPDVTLTLYRVAQEALTNVVKHAPGQPARIELGFAADTVSLSVSNPRSPAGNGSALRDTGAGYGLQGIK
ncbi:MAG TPA: histidine kinase, partial [Acidimicrobiales bacterium]|nr:histidine kinase [Acidimicrobiales bacterium]